jgi:hypothetical protein
MYEFGTDAILSLLARLTFCSLSTGKRCATEFQNTLCFLSIASHQIQTCSGEFEEEERNQKLPKQPVSMSVALRSPSVFGLRSSVTSVSSLAIGWNTISLRTTTRVVARFASADSLSAASTSVPSITSRANFVARLRSVPVPLHGFRAVPS